MSNPKPERGAPREPYNIPIRIYGVTCSGDNADVPALRKLIAEIQRKLNAAIRDGSFFAPPEPARPKLREPRPWQELIQIDPKIQGGRAVIRGTRVLVSALLNAVYAGRGCVEICRTFKIGGDELLAAFCWEAAVSAASLKTVKRRKSRRARARARAA
jgi:uncharacterized protein (DUF433 family)